MAHNIQSFRLAVAYVLDCGVQQAPAIARQAKRFLCFLLFAFTLGPQSGVAADDAELVAQLRNGGYTLYFRHVATDWSEQDRVSKAGDWLSCNDAKMRQLSDSGRADARRIGEAIRSLGIPVGEVLASPYCRTMETAKLFDVGPVIQSSDVMNLRSAGYFGGRDKIIARARRLLATLPAAGANRIVIGHGNVAREATPVYPEEGEGVVFRADGKGGFGVIARIPPQRWRRMLELGRPDQGDSIKR
ncbi:MAG: histidine phosphatase family protein [Candidatus Thiodiazotropha sp.]